MAIYYSHPSIQVNWALDAAVHNAEWPNRKSSIDNNISTSYLARIGWLKTLEDLGIQAKFIHQDHLLEGMLQKGNFKVLLLNRALCLSDAEAAAIKAFSENGGTVIADHLCGVFDEHGKARAAGALDDFFGVKRDLEQGWLDGSALTEVNGELDYKSLSPANWAVKAPLYKEMAVFERGLAAVKNAKGEQAGKASVMVRNGKAVYMNLSPIGYLLKRGAESSKDWLALVSGLMKDAGVEVRVKLAIDGQPAQFTEPIFWRNGDRTTLCVVKNLDRRASIDAFGSIESKLGDTKVKLKLQFAKPVKDLKNERTGKDMGSGTDFEDDFNPWEANVYTYGN
ncbi:MAG: beta-galactosidase trimerization domain-containing protein [Planctomycetota bacterium]|nr:beta-galactosidase trimerization domain-containing protein [Planctomycetota bacterium]